MLSHTKCNIKVLFHSKMANWMFKVMIQSVFLISRFQKVYSSAYHISFYGFHCISKECTLQNYELSEGIQHNQTKTFHQVLPLLSFIYINIYIQNDYK